MYRIRLDILSVNASGSDSYLCTIDNQLEIIEDPLNPLSSPKLCSHHYSETGNLSFQSNRNSMLLLLRTDHQQIVSFTVTYQSMNCCEHVIYTSNNGTFHSISYPQNYLNSQNSTYEIHCLEPNCTIYLKFDSLDIQSGIALLYGGQSDSQCDSDYVEISDRGNFKQKLCGNWTGQVNNLIFSTSTGLLKVRFYSDHVGTSRGFQARWQTVLGDESSCHNDWIEYEESCLFFSSSLANWYQAGKECIENGSHLVKIASKYQYSFINKQLHMR